MFSDYTQDAFRQSGAVHVMERLSPDVIRSVADCLTRSRDVIRLARTCRLSHLCLSEAVRCLVAKRVLRRWRQRTIAKHRARVFADGRLDEANRANVKIMLHRLRLPSWLARTLTEDFLIISEALPRTRETELPSVQSFFVLLMQLRQLEMCSTTQLRNGHVYMRHEHQDLQKRGRVIAMSFCESWHCLIERWNQACRSAWYCSTARPFCGSYDLPPS